MVRTLIVICLILVFMQGVQYRPTKTFDYTSSANALQTTNGVTKVNFDFLAGYEYKEEKDIPQKVKELEGKVVEITGFMLPIGFEGRSVTSFMLMSTRAGCCFGVMPRDNEFIFAKVPKGKDTRFIIDIPLTVTGTLHIGRETLVGGIYSMTVDNVKKN